jgi:phosphate transport system substrate-binding protein
MSSDTLLAALARAAASHKAHRQAVGLAALLVSALLATALLSACAPVQTQPTVIRGHALAVGSTALQPLVTAAAKLFHQENPQADVEVRGGGSKTGLAAVVSHQTDIGDSDIYADPALYPDPNLTDHLVCVIPFAMVVNPDVQVGQLSTAQIINIYSTGQITNWKQVGGPDLPIVPVVRPSTSGTRATFRKYILGGRDENGKLLQSDSSQSVLQAVAQTPGAIGYLAVSVTDSTVKTVAIDGQLPTAAAIQHGQYAFWGYEHMYTLGDNGGVTGAFLDFMLTSAVQTLAQQLGYIPIVAMTGATALTAPAPPLEAALPVIARRRVADA